MAETLSPQSLPRRGARLGAIGRSVLGSLALLLTAPPSTLAQVAPGGLGTRVNGTALGRCSAGVCTVEGGTAAGRTLFHRFSQYDTRSGIRRVDLDSRGRSNVVVGVGHPDGSFFGAPLRLSGNANLFWLSPGGLWFGPGGQIQGATSLLLSTAPSLRIGGETFHAAGGLGDRLGSFGQGAALDLEALAAGRLEDTALASGDGPILLAGGRLSVDRHLLLHSGAGPIHTSPGSQTTLQAGRSVQLSGGTLQLQGLTIQAGTSAADDLVRLRSGPLVGGGFGRLSLSDGSLRATRVLLEGSGGLELERVQAAAGGATEAGEVQISAGTLRTAAEGQLRDVSLAGGRILVRASGALHASDLNAQAATADSSGHVLIETGAGHGNAASLRLQHSTLRGATAVVRAQGPLELETVEVKAESGSTPGQLWLSTNPVAGGADSAAMALQNVSLFGADISISAAGHLDATTVSIGADRLWIQSESPGGAQASLRLAHVKVAGSGRGTETALGAAQVSAAASGDLSADNLQAMSETILLRAGGRLSVMNGSSLKAEGDNGRIQLEAISPSGQRKLGGVEIENSNLSAETITISADQYIHHRNTATTAGSQGRWGLIDMATAANLKTSNRDESGSEGRILIEGSRLKGQRILARSGSADILMSDIRAPKGKVHIQANRGDITLLGSTLDVEVDSVVDLVKSVDRWNLAGITNTAVNTPSIGLYSSQDILIDSSTLNSSQRLTPIQDWNPTLLRDQIRLTDTSGIVSIDAAHSVSINNSHITANATDNLAGNVLIRAQSVEGQGDLTMNNAQISASGGAGSGDIRLISGGGISLMGSRLLSQSHNSPEDPANPGIADWSFLATNNSQAPNGGFTGGEISLSNQASNRPLLIQNTVLKAEQSGDQGPLSTLSLIGDKESRGLIDIFDRSDLFTSRFTGGIITLSSKGGISISGPETELSTTSASADGRTLEDFGGIIRLINTSSQPLLITNQASLESNTGALVDAMRTGNSALGVISAWSRGPIQIEDSSLSSTTTLPLDSELSPLFQGKVSLASQSDININSSTIKHGPDSGGFGTPTFVTPSSFSVNNTVITPGCAGECAAAAGSAVMFNNIVYQRELPEWSDVFDGIQPPSIWGIFGRKYNSLLAPQEDTPVDLMATTALASIRKVPTPLEDTRISVNGSAPVNLAQWLGRNRLAGGPSPEAEQRSMAAPSIITVSIPWHTPEIPTAISLSNQWLQGEPTQALLRPEVATVDYSESYPLSEAAATKSFLDGEQRASQDVMTSLGLSQKYPRPLGINELQNYLRESLASTKATPYLGSEVSTISPAILQISLTANPGNSDLIEINHILIPAGGSIRGWQTQASASMLRETIRLFQNQLSLQEAQGDERPGRQLEALLLRPVMGEIKRQGVNTLLLALDRGLQGVPFAALPFGNSTMVDQLALTITPSLALTDLNQAARTPLPKTTVLAGASHFANGLTPLSMTTQELSQLAALHPDAVLLLDESFRSQTLLAIARSQDVEILHLATHADFSDNNPQSARIYTSNGELSLSDLGRQLRGKQDGSLSLFVLNACRTAVGNEERELGIAGLALLSGAASALGNLWYVDDIVTAAFSVQFHRILQQGVPKSQALQRTQKLFQSGQIRVENDTIVTTNGEVLIRGIGIAERLRLGNALQHPYFWAGAVLTGRPW